MLTGRQIETLAPDAASLKNGRTLAVSEKWQLLGQQQDVIWGEILGSGSKPYQTAIVLSAPAFKCTCPSRKFPCKHAIGLMLLMASLPPSAAADTLPDWVSRWLIHRSDPTSKSLVPDTAKTETQQKAAARRAAEKAEKMLAGVQYLHFRLEDMIRTGLSAFELKSPGFWQELTKRMVDAQAPGLVARLQKMRALNVADELWEQQILQEISLLYLLLTNYLRMAELPRVLQTELPTLIGASPKTEEVLVQGVPQSDTWWVIGARTEIQDSHLTAHFDWLLGKHSAKLAYILQFSFNQAPIAQIFPLGSKVSGTLVFYPGIIPQRATFQEKSNLQDFPFSVEKYASPHWEAVLNQAAELLAVQPWLEEIPIIIKDIQITDSENIWWAVDTNGEALPLEILPMKAYEMLAVTRNNPCCIFGIWNYKKFLPLSYFTMDKVFSLHYSSSV